MSFESAEQFLEKIKNDYEFREEMGNLKSSEERMEKARANGFHFTKEELDKAKNKLLDDDELDAVAGGGSPYPEYPDCFFTPDPKPCS